MKPSIRSSVLFGYSELAISLDLNPLKMIRTVGLPGESLSQSDLMLPVDRVCALFELSAENSGQPSFGLALSKQRRLSHLGQLGLFLRDQPTLGHMVRALENYSKVHNDALTFASVEKDQYTNFYMETKVDSDILTRQFSEFMMGSAFKICQAVFTDASRKMKICFRHGPPSKLQQYIDFFGFKPLFNFEFNGLTYKSSLNDQVNSYADPTFCQQTLSILQALKTSVIAANISDDVRRAVIQLLPSGQCSAQEVAACLGVDRRTVHRQLAAENQNFSSVIDSVRQEISARHVLESDLPIADIAPLLGFKSASALVTWYRRQFGSSPMQHRRQHSTRVINDSPS